MGIPEHQTMKHLHLIIRGLATTMLMVVAAGCSKPSEVAKSAATASAAQPAQAALPKLGPAPAWRLKDVNGNVVSSEQFKGKVVVLDFWATWCGPCRQEIPGYTDLQRKYGKDGLAIIGVLRGAPETLNIKPNEVKSTYLNIEPSDDPTAPGTVSISIYVSSEFGSGYIQLNGDGSVKQINYPS